MKGVELPINVLIIVALAFIVLLALLAMYFTGFSPFSSAVGLEGIKNAACGNLTQRQRCMADPENILLDAFDADQDGLMSSDDGGSGWGWDNSHCGLETVPATGEEWGDNLASLCHCFYNIGSEGECKTMCGCPGY